MEEFMIDKIRKRVKKYTIISIIGAAIMAAALAMHFAGALNWMEYKSYDSRIKQTAKYLTRDDNVVVVILNQESLDWAKEELGWSYPWPRESYGKMVKFFNRGNAASMAFDMVYTEPSIYGDEDDQKFAEADEEFGKTIQAVFYASNTSTKGVLPIDSIKDTAAKIATVQSLLDEDGVARRARFHSSAQDEAQRLNEPSLAVASLELSDEMPDIDTIPKAKNGKEGESESGMYVRFYVSNDENADPNSLDAYLPYSAKTILMSEFLMEYDEMKAGEKSEDDLSLFKPLVTKLDADSEYLHKHFEKNGKTLDENIITKEDVEGGMFEDTHVFFALFAPGLFDICATPIGTNYPGVGVHIAMINTILQEDYLRDIPDYAASLIIIVAVLLGILIAASFPQKSRILTFKIIIFVIAACIYVGISYPLFYKGLILPVVTPTLAFILAFASTITENYVMEGRQRRFLKNAFSQCLAPAVVDQLCENPETFKLGGEKIDMSAIFTDIQKFSSFSELLTAAQLVALLNYYLTRMSDIIIDEQGNVDKYEGDAIIALVGAPNKMKDHAAHACAAAIQMKKAEIVMNKEIVDYASNPKPEDMEDDLYDAFTIMVKNKKTIFTRIGINSGEMIAGYMGSTKKKNYTMMGNNVNLASRLEGVNKQYSTGGIMISEHTRKMIGDRFVVRSLDRVQVVNVKTPLRLYELVEERKDADEKLVKYMADWEVFMKTFEARNYEAALEQVKKLSATKIEQYPDDKVAKYYTKLLENFFVKGTYPTENDNAGVAFNPENGVFTLLQK